MTRFKKIRKAVSLCLLFVFFLLMISGCDVNKRENNGAISVTDSKEENATDEDVIATFLGVNFTGVPMSQEHIDYVKEIQKKL
jgi:hypothetical protein